jgi:hypothetical protein
LKNKELGNKAVINSQIIGPLANHVFTIEANKNSTYYDNSTINLLGGMKGDFVVSNSVGEQVFENSINKEVI